LRRLGFGECDSRRLHAARPAVDSPPVPQTQLFALQISLKQSAPKCRQIRPPTTPPEARHPRTAPPTNHPTRKQSPHGNPPGGAGGVRQAPAPA
jgi:hypothetical protein